MAGNFLVVSGAKEPPPFSVQTFRNVKSKGCLRASQALRDPKRPRGRALESPWGNDGCPCPPAPPLTSLVAHGVRVWCEQTLGTVLGVSCPGGGGAGRTQRRVQWGRVPLTPGRWGGTTGFNCRGPKSQGRVHLPPGPPPLPRRSSITGTGGPPTSCPDGPAMGSGESEGLLRGRGCQALSVQLLGLRVRAPAPPALFFPPVSLLEASSFPRSLWRVGVT